MVTIVLNIYYIDTFKKNSLVSLVAVCAWFSQIGVMNTRGDGSGDEVGRRGGGLQVFFVISRVLTVV